MTLFRQVGGSANDVVSARLNGSDVLFASGRIHRNAVAYAHGIGSAYAFDAEIAFYATINQLIVGSAVDMHLKTASEITDHKALLPVSTHRRKVIGYTTLTGTGRPFIRPGFHAGILLITLLASQLRECSTPRSTLTFDTAPSGMTMKEHITRP